MCLIFAVVFSFWFSFDPKWPWGTQVLTIVVVFGVTQRWRLSRFSRRDLPSFRDTHHSLPQTQQNSSPDNEHGPQSNVKQSPSTPQGSSPAYHDVALAQGVPEGDEHFSRPGSSYRERGLPHTPESGHPKFWNRLSDLKKMCEKSIWSSNDNLAAHDTSWNYTGLLLRWPPRAT